MMKISRSYQRAVLSFFFLLFSLGPVCYGVFFGEVKTGLHNVAISQYGYSLYVPETYSEDVDWPLVLLLPDEGDLAEEYISEWLDVAKERGFMVVSMNYPMPRSFPEKGDKWIIDQKRELENIYAIDRGRVLIAGTGFGGHYALYLGLTYPKEFTAIASIGDALEGRYKKLFKYSFRKANRLPVLLFRDAQHEVSSSSEEELQAMQSRGYSVEVVEADSQVDLQTSSLSPHVFAWFEQVSLKQRQEEEYKGPSVKQRLMAWTDNLLQNR